MTGPLQGRAAVVTGGARRVGRAIALRLAEAGADVAITYLHSERDAAQVVEQMTAMGRRAAAIRADIADPEAPSIVRQGIERQFGRLDILVHNAAIYHATPFGRITDEHWRNHMAVNALGPLRMTQHLADLLAAGEGGRVVHLLDVCVLGRPQRGYAAYSASKAALLDMTHTLALELSPKVTVNAVAPGVVEWAEGMTAAQREAYMRRVPLGRPGTPRDAAEAVLYLVSAGQYLTGQVIRVDGGRWLA